MNENKSLFWVLVNAGLFMILVLGLAGTKALLNYSSSVQPSSVITVSGEGKAVVSPDIATISFSVVTEGKDPTALQKENTTKMNKAIDFVKSEGVDAKDIKTANYDLSPRYDYNKTTGQSLIVGYVLTQSVLVKIRALDKAGEILGGLPNQGVNQVSSLSFDVEDQDKYLNQARQEAFDKALAKAKTMAAQNGVSIVRVVNFSETPMNYPIFYGAYAKGLDSAPSPMPNIQPGTQEVKVDVSVVYEIR